MLDQDIDYCDQQIEAQMEKVQAINSAINQARRDFAEAEKRIIEAKHEKNRIGNMINNLCHKFGRERTILGNMTAHRKQLKNLKKMMVQQHLCVDSQKDKKDV